MVNKAAVFLTALIVMFLSACGHQSGSSCSGKLYNSPSLYVLGTNIYVSIYSKVKSSDPSNPSCPANTNAYDLTFGKSTDGGNNWTSTVVKQKISPSSTPVQLYSQTIAADPTNTNRIYISYIDSTNTLFCATSADGGSTWSSSRVESTTNTTVIGHAIVTGLNGSVYIIYTAVVAGQVNLKFASSTDNSATWSNQTFIDSTPGAGYYPSVAIDSANILYVSYYYAQTNGGLKFAKLTTLGSVLSSLSVKTNDGTVSGPFSSIAATSNGIYIAFYNPGGYTTLAGGYTESKNGNVQLVSSVDGGNNFPLSTNLFNVDTNPYTGRAVSLAANGSNLYVAYGLYQDEGAVTDDRLKFASSTNGGVNFNIRPAEIASGLAVTYNRSGLNYLSSSMLYYSPNGLGKLFLMYAGSGGTNAVFATSSDGGSSWGAINLAL